MNSKEKLVEATIKALQGRLIESYTKEQFDEVCNYIITGYEQQVIKDVQSCDNFEQFVEEMERSKYNSSYDEYVFNHNWVHNWVAYNIFKDDPAPLNPPSLRNKFYKFFWNKYRNEP